MTEVDLLADSPYKWEPLFDGLVMVACAFDDWAMIVQFAYRWFALGGGKGRPVTLLADNSDRLIPLRSEEHTSELQSLMRISYAVFCLKKKKKIHIQTRQQHTTNLIQ